MRNLVALLFLMPSVVFASGSSVGTLGKTVLRDLEPGLSFESNELLQKKDLVRTIGVDRGNIIFQMQQQQTAKIQTVQMRREEFNQETQKYLEAIKKSAATGEWEPVILSTEDSGTKH